LVAPMKAAAVFEGDVPVRPGEAPEARVRG